MIAGLSIDEIEALGSTNASVNLAKKETVKIKIKDVINLFQDISSQELSRFTAKWYQLIENWEKSVKELREN